MTKFALALACLIGTAPLAQAQDRPSDPWSPLRFLVGEWRGAVTGEQGTGTVTRRYRFILSGEYLQERSMASFPPQPLHTDGTVLNYASFLMQDRARKTVLFRQFHQERVNGIFVLSKTQSGPTKLVFESEQLDNAPATWKARETFEVVSPDEYVETFEVAEGGKPLVVRSRIQFKRQRP
ncbi:DUF1579 domain-containing protein [Geothrix oryzisoli]|uniref:DUF1579 domain-containing protein n=1 Tax=Geothrix oryzisoli TaxID=2922721 RepID=UPI001FAB51E5|nr:DUF1579 domain-containing protein [Geothrix oryzisoli]